jgi:hypothetical protein
MTAEEKNNETPATSKNNDDNLSSSSAADLSDRDLHWRGKYKVLKDEHETTVAQSEKIKNDFKELSGKVELHTKERQAIEKKWVEAEVKAHAVAAGIKDPDLVKLIDTSQLKIGENGIEGIQQAINDFKSKKPDFFGAEKKFSSSTNANFPSENKAEKVDARNMSQQEWDAAKMRMKTGGRIY